MFFFNASKQFHRLTYYVVLFFMNLLSAFLSLDLKIGIFCKQIIMLLESQ